MVSAPRTRPAHPFDRQAKPVDFVSAFGDKWHMSAPSDTAPGSNTPPAIAAVIVAAGSGSRMQEDSAEAVSRTVWQTSAVSQC